MVKKLYFFILLIFSTTIVCAQNATLRGQITNTKTRERLQGATVRFDEEKHAVITDENGNYILSVAAGEYKIKVKYVGYAEFEKKIKLSPGQTVVLNITMEQKEENLQAVSVFGRLDKESEAAGRTAEKDANNITNVVTAKVMERSPDINAANVLSRVSGVTIQRNTGGSEAYAMIRGLEPRYNNTLINGVKVTSPDEKSRYVSLDVVPSDLLQKIEVSKSLLPEMEGDAIGGTINMVFKDAPDTMLIKANAQIGYSQIFLDRKFQSFSTADISSKSPLAINGDDYKAQPGDFSRSNLDFKQKTALPSAVAGLTYGNRYLDGKLGIMIADNYQNQYFGTNSQFNPVVANPQDDFKPGITDFSNLTYSNHQINNGLAVHADYIIDKRNKILFNNVFLYSYLAQARLGIDTAIVGGNGGRNGPGTGTVTDDNRSLVQKELLENFKLEGKHILSKHLLFDWAGVFSVSTKKMPDEADISINHLIKTDFTSTPDYFDGITHTWQHNNDKDEDGIANLTYKGKINDHTLELKVGGLYRHKDRFNEQDQYQLKPLAGADGGKQIYTGIENASWSVYNAKGTADYDVNNYTAFEDITAGYAEFKLSLNKLDIFGGVREENTSQGFDYATFIPTAENAVRKNYTDVLPSLQLNYKLNAKTNIRASYFKSLSRPNYYELVPYNIQGTNGTSETGNPNLKHATADNFDLRYELYPKDDEQLFISGFYKKLYDPIELELTGFGGGDITYKPTNIAPEATIEGVELVYTKYFGRIGVSANYAYIYSNVTSLKDFPDTTQKNTAVGKLESRPLQGQTKNSANASLMYRDGAHKVFVQLAYQYIGTTLSQVYNNYGYDYYHQPQSFLALSGEKGVGKHFTLFGKFNNLLNTPTTTTINNITVGRDIYKANYNIGLRYVN
ncbi:TonB-dependent receptor [Mucilaginibacter sp. dw_454]|uniref:TonB-dependent receptor n=1 Tax=Mucilaginibacter sp. dw_454 TaxID=2720079 RepID=UPI001BD3635E|nr:TonB-dependent receptor [Mucilaginibacter sp. dw_454]